MVLTGLTAKSLSPQIADPTTHFDVACKAMAMAINCPYRVFTGTEQGELAGSQDAAAWAGMVQARRENHVDPNIIRPVYDRLIGLGILQSPEEKDGQPEYVVKWRGILETDEETRSKIQFNKTQALAQYAGSQAESVMTPVDYLVLVFGLAKEEAEEVVASARKELGALSDSIPEEEETEEGEESATKKGKQLQQGTGIPKKEGAAQVKPALNPNQMGKAIIANHSKKQPSTGELSALQAMAAKGILDKFQSLVNSLYLADISLESKDAEAVENAKAQSSAALKEMSMWGNELTPKRRAYLTALNQEAADVLDSVGLTLASRWHRNRADTFNV